MDFTQSAFLFFDTTQQIATNYGTIPKTGNYFMRELYLGLISGTSADGIDAALVEFDCEQPKLIATHSGHYSKTLRQSILDLYQPGANEINRLGEIDILIAKAFAETANGLLQKVRIAPEQICAIGSHGQTIRHEPKKNFTIQIGDPNVIAAETGITTIADFRRRDMAHGGQGAPLVPAFHQHIFSGDSDRVIVNIGGIANITVLPAHKQQNIIGYDTGPGNALLDKMSEIHLQKMHDSNGEWAATGKVIPALLKKLLNDDYFKLPYPKSTGREYFHLEWLRKYLSSNDQPVDVQTTLVELTATTIVTAIQQHFSQGEIFICGGGVHNQFLMSRIRALAPQFSITSTEIFGIHPDWVEAMAFAWLAQQTMHKKPGNLTTVTGARKSTILGGVYYS